VQSYSYFVGQPSEYCRHYPLCCFSTSVYCFFHFVIDSVLKLLDTPSYDGRCLHFVFTYISDSNAPDAQCVPCNQTFSKQFLDFSTFAKIFSYKAHSLQIQTS